MSFGTVQFFAFGTSLMALGFSLLRMPRPGSTLRGYALAVIIMGIAYAAFAARAAYLPAIAADLFLARLFWPARVPSPSSSPQERTEDHASAWPATR